MKDKKLGQEPAFPFTKIEMGQFGEYTANYNGISKRFYAACAAMQSVISSTEFLNGLIKSAARNEIEINKAIAKVAFDISDAILIEEQNG